MHISELLLRLQRENADLRVQLSEQHLINQEAIDKTAAAFTVLQNEVTCALVSCHYRREIRPRKRSVKLLSKTK